MQIRDMFQKPIDRDIKGVIKVGQDDDENIRQELEEYVVTRELSRHFADFFSSYKKGVVGNTDKMGVWISGFFGSGKSHFLKILSYLLGNKEAGGKRALDYFIDDDKIADAMVLADMKLCADMAPRTDVVLFNIDSKSEQAGKQSKDAIVSVFLKVFNEMQGFCGSIPHLADLERSLSDAGLYDEFKRRFEGEHRKPWTDARHNFDFIQDGIVDVLGAMGYMSEAAARNWCEKAAGAYEISIEAFAKRVAEYIAGKGANHHVVFLADEIGQYIGEDSRLMLNLQTVTEDLGTACRGKAWVIVTSQQDIDAIARDMGLRSNDFSKIQGRFDTRLSLSSANADEVIRKRILAKNETAERTLRALYEQKETLVKNLIVWNDGVEKKLYSGGADFASVYPFVPYQFNLLAGVLTSIRTHGASGKHLSEGERSMLALFKESAVKLMDREAGAVVPFNVFYDALHRFLDHSHAGVVIRASENEAVNPDKNPDKAETCFAVELLKALFMVKYVGEVESNTDNLVSLMVDSLDADRIALKRKVEDALKVLTEQKLVQKNGETYVFLTNEEQEINREIDGQTIEMAEVTAKVSDMIFEDVFGEKRYRCPAHGGRYTFAFNQSVDEHPHRANQSHDIGLRVLTPNADDREETTLRMVSSQGKEVLAALPDDRAFFDELRESMKIEKYLKTASGGILAKYEQIKAAKSEEMRRRAEDAKLFLREALKNADIYVNGDKAQMASKDAASRLNDALGKLVSAVYHKLSYIETPMNEADIRKLFFHSNQQQSNQQALSLDGGAKANAYALADVLSFIETNSAAHTKTSMKTLLDRFQKAPYGFVEDDVKWLTAKLFRDGEIALTVSGEAVTLTNKSEAEIVRYLTKREFAEKLLAERRERADEKQKKAAREVMKELFGSSGLSSLSDLSKTPDEDDAIIEAFRRGANERLELIKEYENLSRDKPYPGKTILDEGKALLRSVTQAQSAAEFFRTVTAERDACLDFAEDFEPVMAFFGGEQKKIFDDALGRMRLYEESKIFIVDDTVEKRAAEIKDILNKTVPYADIPKLPELLKDFGDAYKAVLDGMAPPVYGAIEDAQRRVFDELNPKPCKDELAPRFLSLFGELKDKADRCVSAADFQIIKAEADALKMRLLREITQKEERLSAQNPPVPHAQETAEISEGFGQTERTERTERTEQTEQTKQIAPPPVTPKPPRVKSVSIRSVNVGGTWRMTSKADIDARLEELRARLYSEMEGMEEGTALHIEF
ncbi:MAG: BREX system P-loop protein BrxC [Synergistaceae bacterium]|jgi:hypothetical protein|nr:BREX system P-loop protein BrxC [Synergistaceae bacterium]